MDTTRIKTAFEQAIIYFGKTSAGRKKETFSIHLISCIDLWLMYLDYLKEHRSLDFVTISRVHSRALHTLDSDQLTRFNTSCAMKNLTP